MSQSLIDEIDSYLAPGATYHNWRPSMETMRELVETLRNPPSATPDRNAIIERGEAVNLASNIVSRGDTGSYLSLITDEGVKELADAVLLMDGALKESAAPLHANNR